MKGRRVVPGQRLYSWDKPGVANRGPGGRYSRLGGAGGSLLQATKNQIGDEQMRTQAKMLLAAIAFALPTFAQTEGQDAEPAPNTEKLWRLECSGIGG